jgi:hypothetical protein
MKPSESTQNAPTVRNNRARFAGMKSFLIVGTLVSFMPWAIGCSALDPRKMCEKELADTRAQLEQTSKLANELSSQVRAQQAELQDLKEHNIEDVRREKERTLAQIDIKRQELEQERFEIDRMRELQQAELTN